MRWLSEHPEQAEDNGDDGTLDAGTPPILKNLPFSLYRRNTHPRANLAAGDGDSANSTMTSSASLEPGRINAIGRQGSVVRLRN